MSDTLIADALSAAASKAAHRELTWLTKKVAQSQKGVFSEVVTITPELAQRLLENNPDNRKPRPLLIRQIVADLKHDKWQLNGEAVVIARTGELNDGQNRLQAIIEAQVAAPTVMVFGVERTSRETVDMGVVRSAIDVLGMQGVANANHAAAVAKLWVQYQRGVYAGDRGSEVANPEKIITRQDVYDFYTKHAKQIDGAIVWLRNEQFVRKAGMITPVVVAYLILRQLDLEKANTFFAKLVTGDELPRGSPILFCRQMMMEVSSRRLRPWVKLELMLRYWNAWIQKREMQRKIMVYSEYPKLEV